MVDVPRDFQPLSIDIEKEEISCDYKMLKVDSFDNTHNPNTHLIEFRPRC
ncbi:hypothetical protein Fmac_032370 [Flemingia macrophylla]|uniref:Uncharacterized protein n=1 Tax=Flemingia macrophylla TaxID=520843 RepID=A0ABD1L4R5_9FABA